jgi:alpha-glucosidase (family GH31 glycosyl hydrolase)
VQQCNLGGTYRTLDGYDGDRYYSWQHDKPGQGQPLPLENGLLARDGWTLIDDSEGLLFDGDVNDLTSPELPWVKQRQTAASDKQEKATDWYFMAYGHDYKQALGDFTLLAGRIPLPPRYSFGYWWSRYWSYSDGEMRQVVSDFERYGIPLDVLVVDMDWHWTEPGLGGWTGYTWNNRLFPSPE